MWGDVLSVDENQLSAVDQFLANPAKVLEDYQPHWTFSPGYRDHQITWTIFEEDTGRTRGSLRFRVPERHSHFPSISLIFRGNNVSRIDRDAEETCKANPPFAQELGLPPTVCGTHIHAWSDNRSYVYRTGVWALPVRRPIEDQIGGINDMFFWFCGHINVRIQPHNTPLAMPDEGLWSRSC